MKRTTEGHKPPHKPHHKQDQTSILNMGTCISVSVRVINASMLKPQTVSGIQKEKGVKGEA